MRSNILSRVAEAEAEISRLTGPDGRPMPSSIGTAPTRTASLALTGTTGS